MMINSPRHARATDGQSLSAEDVARRYARRYPGYRLVNCEPVVLPVFRIQVRVLTNVRKKVPPLQEFVLRAIGAGLAHAGEIAGFLGLDTQVMNRILSDLVIAEAVYLAGAAGDRSHRLVLTEQGKGTLNTLTLERPEEDSETFFLDGLTRCLIPRPAQQLLRGADVRSSGLTELAPYPRTRPEIREFQEQMLREWQVDHRDSELLAVLAVERTDSVFRDDVLLLSYRPDGIASDTASGEQVGFVIGGHWSEAHADAFRKGDSDRGFPLLQQGSITESAHLADLLPERLVEVMASYIEVATLLEQIAQSEARLLDLSEQLRHVPARQDKEAIAGEIKVEEALRTESERRLNALPIRETEIFEYPALFERALSTAKRRLLIVAPLTQNTTLPKDLVRRIEETLRRGVSVFIGYSGSSSASDAAVEPIPKPLKDLQERYPKTLLFAGQGVISRNILLCDSKFYVATRFNWIASGSKVLRGSRDARGICVSVAGEVDKTFNDFLSLARSANQP